MYFPALHAAADNISSLNRHCATWISLEAAISAQKPMFLSGELKPGSKASGN